VKLSVQGKRLNEKSLYIGLGKKKSSSSFLQKSSSSFLQKLSSSFLQKLSSSFLQKLSFSFLQKSRFSFLQKSRFSSHTISFCLSFYLNSGVIPVSGMRLRQERVWATSSGGPGSSASSASTSRSNSARAARSTNHGFEGNELKAFFGPLFFSFPASSENHTIAAFSIASRPAFIPAPSLSLTASTAGAPERTHRNCGCVSATRL